MRPHQNNVNSLTHHVRTHFKFCLGLVLGLGLGLGLVLPSAWNINLHYLGGYGTLERLTEDLIMNSQSSLLFVRGSLS